MTTTNHKTLNTQDYKKLPEESGVYLFFNKNRKLLYVGKAINLKKRVFSYFSGREKDPRKQKMVLEIRFIKFITTQSETEALILESKLIKKFLPPYNISLRDDKQYFFVAITNDVWPIIYLTHQRQNSTTKYIGPFTNGASIKFTLKLLRKSFPYLTIKHKNNRPCSWCHIGLCPFASDDIQSYLKNLSTIEKFLSGNYTKIIKSLKKEMALSSKKEDFENCKTSFLTKALSARRSQSIQKSSKNYGNKLLDLVFQSDWKRMTFLIFRGYWLQVQWWCLKMAN